MQSVNVGILGLGTVGSGTIAVLRRNLEEISRRAGREIAVTRAADRTLEKERTVDVSGIDITTDAFSIVNDPNIDVVVELIGGTTIAK
ncbi:MAG TPA: homoserine dehydrogenase, partial [Gammaproteobacteria bacterium]|nr:homoserine dehydrogenase [Gammaproteobacteria bacterium]